MKTIVLPPKATAFVLAGGRDLAAALIPGGVGLEPAQAAALAGTGGEHLGVALSDPENGMLRIFLRADEGERVDPTLLRARAEAALARRREAGLLDACRLVHGAGDGLPGLTADRFGDWLVVYAYSRAFVGLGGQLARTLLDQAGLRGAIVKVRSRGAVAGQEIRQEIVGDEPPERFTALERGVPFELHVTSGLNVGLFTDLREVRHGLQRYLPDGGEALNLFAYTGSLSVLMARAGATVTSVDLSAGVLRWAEDNFRLSEIDPAAHRFVAQDASRFLKDACRERRRYHLVVVDPPSFSVARGAGFSIERDLPELIRRAGGLVDLGGHLVLCSNARRLDLERLAAAAFARAGHAATLVDSAGLAVDYPTLEAQPDDRYLKVAVYRVQAAAEARPLVAPGGASGG